jgi:hypothetical protein
MDFLYLSPSAARLRSQNDTERQKSNNQRHDLWTEIMTDTAGGNNNSRRHRLQEARGPFYIVGCILMGRNADLAADAMQRRFRANFGVGSIVCNVAWKLLKENGRANAAEPKHLLYALKWLKTNGTEHVLASDLRINEKTLRKWVWFFVNALADQETDVVRPFQPFFSLIPLTYY